MLAPPGTPKDIVEKLNAALRAALNQPEVSKRLEVVDGEISPSTPQEFEQMIKMEVIKWKKLLGSHKPKND